VPRGTARRRALIAARHRVQWENPLTLFKMLDATPDTESVRTIVHSGGRSDVTASEWNTMPVTHIRLTCYCASDVLVGRRRYWEASHLAEWRRRCYSCWRWLRRRWSHASNRTYVLVITTWQFLTSLCRDRRRRHTMTMTCCSVCTTLIYSNFTVQFEVVFELWYRQHSVHAYCLHWDTVGSHVGRWMVRSRMNGPHSIVVSPSTTVVQPGAWACVSWQSVFNVGRCINGSNVSFGFHTQAYIDISFRVSLNSCIAQSPGNIEVVHWPKSWR